MDLWEPEEEEPKAEQMVAYDLQDTRAEQRDQATGHEKSQDAFQRMAVLGHRLARLCCPISGPSNGNIPTAIVSTPLHIRDTVMAIQIAKLIQCRYLFIALLDMALEVGGLLLAIAILGNVNVVCQHIEDLQPLA